MQAGKRRATGLSLVSMMLLLLVAPGAGGQENVSIEIPLDTVVRGDPGSEHVLGSAEVPQELHGVTCPVASIAENQTSVHPGNDLVVATDGDSIVLADVERASGAVTVAEEELTLGSVLTVTLVMGPDGVFSAGMVVKLCDIPETTTTTTTVPETTTTTLAATTTIPETTTTLATTTTTTETTTTVTVLPTTTVTVAPESTTTVTVAAESTTTLSGTLPFTGGGTEIPALAGLIALLAGVGLVALTREEADS